MRLPVNGREYAHFAVNVPASVALEVSFDGLVWTPLARPDDATAAVLVAGPDATDSPPGTVVLTRGSHQAVVRLVALPEIVIRQAGTIYV